MSIKIDEYLNSISALAAASVQSTTAAQESTQTQKEDCDSYIPSGADANAVLPSDNYNDILKIMQSAGTEETGTGTSSGAQTSAGESGSVSGSAAAGGGAGGSEEEDETTTEVVTVNGVTYLETTTTTDGVTTVTRTVIGKE